MVTWMVSKCVHIAGVGFVSRPCRNVSLCSRKLKSSGENGRGTPSAGRMAKRRIMTLSPAHAAAIFFLCASRANSRSARANRPAPSAGQAKARAATMAAAPHSRISSEAFDCGAVGDIGPVQGPGLDRAGFDSASSTCRASAQLLYPVPAARLSYVVRPIAGCMAEIWARRNPVRWPCSPAGRLLEHSFAGSTRTPGSCGRALLQRRADVVKDSSDRVGDGADAGDTAQRNQAQQQRIFNQVLSFFTIPEAVADQGQVQKHVLHVFSPWQ